MRFLPDGGLAFTGRIDDQVKIRGFRIEPGEIETQLLRVEGVREAVVVVQGSGSDKYLAAYVASDLTAEALRQSLQQTLPGYMMPAAFMLLPSLPLNANGKVDRHALPEPERQTVEAYVAPSTETEARLAAIWKEVLRLDAEVSVTGNFFELGGDSLLATRIASVVSQAFGRTLPVRALFEHNNVRALARHLEQQDETAHAAIPIADRTRPLPLSFAQQRLWFIDQLEEGSAQYNVPGALRLSGSLDRAALQATFDAIIDRHDVLRTRFVTRGDEAIQQIGVAEPLPLHFADLTSLDAVDRDTAVQRLAEEEAARPFDLTRDLMLRVVLLQLAEEEHVLLFTMHHIASDGWSLDVLVGEFAALYTAYSQPGRRQNPLTPLPIQYADYAAWQRAQLEGEAYDRHVDYWRVQLAGIPPVHSLPLDKPRPAQQRFEGGTIERTLDGQLVAQLEKLAHSHRATLFMVLQSAFALLLGRWSRSDDVVMGSPIAGREHRDLDPLIGFFVNTLVLRTRLSETQSFHMLLEEAKQTALDAYAHQAIPFETLVDELKPERTLGHGALFQIMFSLLQRTAGMPRLPNLELSPLGRTSTLTKFDLNLTAIEGEQELSLQWHYAASLFERESIERMAAGFELLLRGIVATPDRPIYALPIVTEVVRSKGATIDRSSESCVHVAFETQAAATPDAIAVIAGERTLTYRTLNEQANRLAHALLAKALPARARVGFHVERSPEALVSMLGILKAGLAYVPFEPSNTADRLQHIITNGEIECVAVQRNLVAKLPAGLQLIVLDEELNHAIHNPAVAVSHDDSAYVMYTSGSTGVPKGVEITHAGLLDYCAFASEHYYSERLRGSFVVTSHGFDITVPSLYVPLLRGGSVNLTAPGEELLALAEMLSSDGNNGAECAYLLRMTPMHVAGVLSLLPTDLVRNDRHVFVIGGEAFPAALARDLQARFPNARIYNHYGPTETVVGCSIFDVTAALRADEVSMARLPIGRAMDNHELYVLNEAQQLAPVGVAGELCIGGAGVAKGYVNQPDVTAARFIANPFGEGRLYRSGDVVRMLPSGDLEFLGRVDDQIKIRGFRIEPGEIEATLKQTVNDALVVVQGEEENKALVAYVIAEDDSILPELKARLAKALPDYMIPTGWCVLSTFPLNANGKIDRKALPAVLRQAPKEHVEPSTQSERWLAGIWQTVLKLETSPSVTAQLLRARRALASGHACRQRRQPSRSTRRSRCARSSSTAPSDRLPRTSTYWRSRHTTPSFRPDHIAGIAALLRPAAPLVPRPAQRQDAAVTTCPRRSVCAAGSIAARCRNRSTKSCAATRSSHDVRGRPRHRTPGHPRRPSHRHSPGRPDGAGPGGAPAARAGTGKGRSAHAVRSLRRSDGARPASDALRHRSRPPVHHAPHRLGRLSMASLVRDTSARCTRPSAAARPRRLRRWHPVRRLRPRGSASGCRVTCSKGSWPTGARSSPTSRPSIACRSTSRGRPCRASPAPRRVQLLDPALLQELNGPRPPAATPVWYMVCRAPWRSSSDAGATRATSSSATPSPDARTRMWRASSASSSTTSSCAPTSRRPGRSTSCSSRSSAPASTLTSIRTSLSRCSSTS